LEYASPKYGRLDPLAEKAATEAQAEASANSKPVDQMSDAELEALVRSSHPTLPAPENARAAGQLYDQLLKSLPGSLDAQVAAKALELTAESAPSAMQAPAQHQASEDAEDQKGAPKAAAMRPAGIVGDGDFHAERVVPLEQPGATLIPAEPAVGPATRRRELKTVESPRCSSIMLRPGPHRIRHPDGTAETFTVQGGDAQWWQPAVAGRYVVDGVQEWSHPIRRGAGINLLPFAEPATPSGDGESAGARPNATGGPAEL
jgi:hypothetical protein